MAAAAVNVVAVHHIIPSLKIIETHKINDPPQFPQHLCGSFAAHQCAMHGPLAENHCLSQLSSPCLRAHTGTLVRLREGPQVGHGRFAEL